MKLHLLSSVARSPFKPFLLMVLLAISLVGGVARPSTAAGQRATDRTQTSPGLLITEIMYNPSGGQEYEFIELKNLGAASFPLGGVAFVAGIAFTFPTGAGLAPGAFAVLVQDPAAFTARYPGIPIAGVYSGRLDNAGERVTLSDPTGATLIELTYDDAPPWPTSADGLGYSLVNADAAGDPNLASTWRASTLPNG
ncbi:MAG TPA: lamin tail domain-containing protein, partial [Anaerolineae bacterium]|nr:lamin tail domain-containing protein [Anaerolineae bacterium]